VNVAVGDGIVGDVAVRNMSNCIVASIGLFRTVNALEAHDVPR
jgi:hypothetical protein